eukprot:TRINITY_DN279_c0_g1_i1.p2 TRINITY_DN279_c0_g1~~TRINITY_DN279_c0_g1_i1.p2  ORF type:complete len:87 (+),score=14.75 TRINITY_DN279_c0_g1_i1:374-634(+)
MHDNIEASLKPQEGKESDLKDRHDNIEASLKPQEGKESDLKDRQMKILQKLDKLENDVSQYISQKQISSSSKMARCNELMTQLKSK